jgi:uncharacterized protein with HEPN domain
MKRSSRRDPRKYLWDAREAAAAIVRFITGKTFDDYLADRLLSSAVERQFEIIGEALSQLAKLDRALAAQVPDWQQIIAFRNILVHGYAEIDDSIVWDAARNDLGHLTSALDVLLGDDETA